ncbi:MAG TPA: hypothetical protein VL485_01815 [Ktedonobacteraceae bacterium]|nr:hypothetical protein [Ktedonobacteraceae bacterium]
MSENMQPTLEQVNLNEYVPYSEALELFQPLDKNAFFYRVRKKEIASIEGETERDTRYKASDVVTVRDKLRKKKSLKSNKQILETEVDWQKISDLPAILKLDLTVFKENIVGDIGLYISWERKNPQITLLSFEKGNRENVLAYISLVPLPEKIILSILRGEREELSISADEVEDYQRKGGYALLAESIVAHPDHPEQINHLLREILRFWCESYPDRYIEKIYAQAASNTGDVLIQKLFFAPLYELADNAHVLDMKRPGASKFIKNFQQCLKDKEQALKASHE